MGIANAHNLESYARAAGEKVNEIIPFYSGDYLYQRLVITIEKELIKPLIQSGIIANLSHIELLLRGEHLLTVPLGEGPITEASNPAATIVTADYPLEAIHKTAQRITQMAVDKRTKPEFDFNIISK